MIESIDADGVITGVPEVRKPFVRSPFNYDRDLVSHVEGLACLDPTRTQQQFAEEVDINTIVKRFGLTGELPENVRVPLSGDFDTVHDFQSAMNMVRAAEEAFMELPADVRYRFNNDPQRLQEFVENKDNLDEARKLGLAVPAPEAPKPPEPVLVKVLDEKTSST